MKKIMTMMMMMILGFGAFANEYIKNTDAEYEKAITNQKNKYDKAIIEMSYACFKDNSLKHDFEKYKNKWIEIYKNNNLVFVKEEDQNFAKSVMFLGLTDLYEPMIKYADGKNLYINLIYVRRGIIKINKEVLINCCNNIEKNKRVYNEIYFCKQYVDLIKQNQSLLTPEETVKYFKTIKRNIYSNITKSEQWKSLVIQVELMIKANE